MKIKYRFLSLMSVELDAPAYRPCRFPWIRPDCDGWNGGPWASMGRNRASAGLVPRKGLGGRIARAKPPGDTGGIPISPFRLLDGALWSDSRREKGMACRFLESAPGLSPVHFLYLRPLPQGHGSLRPSLGRFPPARIASSAAPERGISRVSCSRRAFGCHSWSSLNPNRSDSSLDGCNAKPSPRLLNVLAQFAVTAEHSFGQRHWRSAAMQGEAAPRESNPSDRSWVCPSWRASCAMQLISLLASRVVFSLSASKRNPNQ